MHSAAIAWTAAVEIVERHTHALVSDSSEVHCALSSDDSIRRHTISLLAPDLLLEACLTDCLS